MKLVGHANKLETNVKGPSQEFGIGDASVVIEILRNRLYKHKIRTLTQEYISNARDAMREVNSDRAIKVTAPSQYDPTFKVRDFGPGVSPERMSSVFVLYGASTKRSSNKETGGFGIGAKSAWAYTDSFNIVTYIDGVRRTYVAHTGENNNGRLDLISEDETDQENGTEIQIGVSPSDVDQFHQAILRATYFWNEPVELNGVEHSLIDKDSTWFTDHLEIVNDLPRYVCLKYSKHTMAVIDGIPYNINDLSESVAELAELESLVSGQLVFHVPNGFLEVSASREEVSDSEHTLKNLKALCKKLSKEVHKHIVKQFSEATTVEKYLKAYIELQSSFNVHKYSKFDAYEMNHHAIQSELFNIVNVYECSTNHRTGGLQKVNIHSKKGRVFGNYKLGLELFDNVYVDESGESKVKQNKRIRSFLKENHTMILLQCMDDQDQNCIDAYEKLKKDLAAKNVSDIEIEELPKVVTSKSRDKEAVCLHVLERNRWANYNSNPYIRAHKDVYLQDNNSKFLYVVLEGNSWTDYSKDFCYNLDQYLDEYTVCGVSKSNYKRIKHDDNFTPLKDFLESYKPSTDDIQRAKYTHTEDDTRDVVDFLETLKGIKDPFVNQMLKEYKALQSFPVPQLILELCNKSQEVIDFISQNEKFKKLIDTTYPLVKEFTDGYRLEKSTDGEIVFYINAKYKGVK